MTVMLHRYDFSILLFLFYGNDHLLIMGQRMLAVIFGLNEQGVWYRRFQHLPER